MKPGKHISTKLFIDLSISCNIRLLATLVKESKQGWPIKVDIYRWSFCCFQNKQIIVGESGGPGEIFWNNLIQNYTQAMGSSLLYLCKYKPSLTGSDFGWLDTN